MKKLMMTGLTAAVLSFSAGTSAGEVTGYTVPQTGQAATAAGVDDNFQALITAINDNATRIAELESFDVSGKTYEYREIGFILAAKRQGQTIASPDVSTFVNQGFARIGIFTATGSFTFDANGNFSIDLVEYETEMFVNNDSDMGPMTSASGDNLAGTGTWNQTGSTVTLLFDGDAPEDAFDAEINKGASMLTITNQGIGGQVAGNCQQEIINGNQAAVEVCLHEWDTSFGVATRSN